jgi:hypothetical protein
MFTEDEPYPVRSEPVPMDFQAPLHTPYGTAERTYDDFWGVQKNALLERRNLLPDYAVVENEWDRNPRECGKQISERTLNPYETEGSFNSAMGADLVRSIDTKEAGITRYTRFHQTTNPTAYNADPIIGGSSGGGVPTLGPYIGKSGSDKPSWIPGYVPPAGGGSSQSAPPVEPGMRLPSATRSNRQHEEIGNAVGGNTVADYGDEFVNPQLGGRPSLLATEYEHWGYRNGGFVSSGGDWEAPSGEKGISTTTMWNPNDGARYRYVAGQDGANDPLSAHAPVPTGPSMDVTPKIGGRPDRRINFERIIGGANTFGVGSGSAQNPQEGGRVSKRLNWENIGSGGTLAGIGSGLVQNPQEGGRATKIVNWENVGSGGISAGIGSSLVQNPQEGGRATRIVNWENIGSGGISAGVGSDMVQNPQEGGRATRIINWENIGSGGISAGVGSDMVQNPQEGGRATRIVNWENIGSGGISAGVGSDMVQNPQEGGRATRIINWENIGSGGISAGVGSNMVQNPQEGGRATRIINWENIGSGGISEGVGSGLMQNPQDGGKPSKLMNFDMLLPGGLSRGVGSSIENNPRDGGRISRSKNWQQLNPGGIQSGMSGVGISDIVGGEHWARTEGCPGYLPPGGSLRSDYGGIDVSFGLEVSPRTPRVDTNSMMIPGTSGGHGTPKIPEMFLTLPNTRRNGNGVYDDSPDPTLQIAARSLMGAKKLLNFNRENMDDLAFSVPCA